MSEARVSPAQAMRWVTVAFAGSVAVGAFGFTARATQAYARSVGLHGDTAVGLPLFIEACVVIGGLDLAAAKLSQREDDAHEAHALSLSLLVFGVLSSAAINAMHGYEASGGSLIAAALSIAPVLTMPLCVHVALDRIVRAPQRPRSRRRTRARTQAPAPTRSAAPEGDQAQVTDQGRTRALSASSSPNGHRPPERSGERSGERSAPTAEELRELLPTLTVANDLIARTGSKAAAARSLNVDRSKFNRRYAELEEQAEARMSTPPYPDDRRDRHEPHQ